MKSYAIHRCPPYLSPPPAPIIGQDERRCVKSHGDITTAPDRRTGRALIDLIELDHIPIYPDSPGPPCLTPRSCSSITPLRRNPSLRRPLPSESTNSPRLPPRSHDSNGPSIESLLPPARTALPPPLLLPALSPTLILNGNNSNEGLR